VSYPSSNVNIQLHVRYVRFPTKDEPSHRDNHGHCNNSWAKDLAHADFEHLWFLLRVSRGRGRRGRLRPEAVEYRHGGEEVMRLCEKRWKMSHSSSRGLHGPYKPHLLRDSRPHPNVVTHHIAPKVPIAVATLGIGVGVSMLDFSDVIFDIRHGSCGR
jgi:hypothetical protein